VDIELAGEIVLVHVNFLAYITPCQLESLQMPPDFISATDALLATPKLDELAHAIGCSVASVKQARMKAGEGHRSPPPGWEAGIAHLARRKAVQLQKLADRLS
jgi:hypothetical protein